MPKEKPLQAIIYHIPCGKPCFLYDHRPERGERITRGLARRLDGSAIPAEEFLRCGSCNRLPRADELHPDPNEISTYDMSSTSDMEKLYGVGGNDT